MAIEDNFTKSYLTIVNDEERQRRIKLLNDPNYGIVLCYLDRFRSILDMPDYPLQLFEDHLVSNEQPSESIQLIS